MTGLILVIIAFVLIVVEAHVPSFGIFGVAAIASLLAGGKILVDQGSLFGIPMDWNIFIGIAIALAITTAIMVKVAARSFSSPDTAGPEGMIGKDATVEDWSDKTGRVMIQGELWQAFSERDHNFKKGDLVTVSETHELKLKIRLKD
ncbi:MAG TPA: NfeD family protein [Alphaproteobacteria bacterium]|nr:NfeD family protein [Alphaproteobacteria bacterium]HNS43879.1 NfeD family protein [Alphaproteobacteria bacterium]